MTGLKIGLLLVCILSIVGDFFCLSRICPKGKKAVGKDYRILGWLLLAGGISMGLATALDPPPASPALLFLKVLKAVAPFLVVGGCAALIYCLRRRAEAREQ